MNIIRIECWSIVHEPCIDPFRAPETLGLCFAGKVYNHPRVQPGQYVSTSPIVGFDGELFRTYSGSLYQLGEPDPQYESKYPGAKERLIQSFLKQKGLSVDVRA